MSFSACCSKNTGLVWNNLLLTSNHLLISTVDGDNNIQLLIGLHLSPQHAERIMEGKEEAITSSYTVISTIVGTTEYIDLFPYSVADQSNLLLGQDKIKFNSAINLSESSLKCVSALKPPKPTERHASTDNVSHFLKISYTDCKQGTVLILLRG